MSLHLTAYWEAMASLHPELTPARIISQERGMYRIQTAEGSMNASVSGKFQFESRSPSAFPAVGDYVMADLSDPDTVVIHAILPRKTLFLRQAADGRKEQAVAANIDTVFLCVSMNADFNLRRLERYLVAARESGARPVVVFTKTDLIDFVPEVLEEVKEVSGDADIVMTSVYGEDGFGQLLPYLEAGSTVVFVGSSGVGKSTLVNCLLGEERQEVGEVGELGQGRHTTRRRDLFELPGGAMVIDTPGMRELGMWDAESGVEQTFDDVEAVIASCRFSDCTHRGEPGCAVRAALESGELDGERWESYLKLKAENEEAAEKARRLAAKQEKFRQNVRTGKYGGKGGTKSGGKKRR